MSDDSSSDQATSGEVITDIGSLLQLTDIKSVVFNEVSAKRTENEDAGDEEELARFAMQISSQLTTESIAVRCNINVTGAGGNYISDATAVFALSRPVEIDARR